MVAIAEIGDHGHLAAVEGQSFAQQAAPGGFQHSGIHVGVEQYVAGAFRAAAIAGIDTPALDVDAGSVGHAHAQATGGQCEM